MTYRERRLAKAERLREWAAAREAKAAAAHKANEIYRGDTAFLTQPGHIPERARVIARTERAFADSAKAAEMSSRAAGIEAAADGAIYSDDPDAIEALVKRIEERTARRDAMKVSNDAFRKDKVHRMELAACTSAYQRDQLMPHKSFEIRNLTADIKRNQERLDDLRGFARCAAYGCGARFIGRADLSQWSQLCAEHRSEADRARYGWTPENSVD